MKIRSYSHNSGSQMWRFAQPFKYLNRLGWDAKCVQSNIADEDIKDADIVCLKAVVDKEAIATVLAHREENGLKLVVDVDDALFTDPENPYWKTWEVTDASFVITQTVKTANLITTTTESLASEMRKLNNNVVVVPNMYDPEWFDVTPRENDDGTVRIGWSGSFTHIKDLQMVAPALNEILERFPNVKIIICGDSRMKGFISNPSRCEIYQPTPFNAYPKRLESMYVDIGIAPLESNEFNKYKSHIKAMEYSLLKIPAVCSPVVYGDLPYVRTANNHGQWVDHLSKLIVDKKLRQEQGKNAYNYVTKHNNLKKNIEKWKSIYESLQ